MSFKHIQIVPQNYFSGISGRYVITNCEQRNVQNDTNPLYISQNEQAKTKYIRKTGLQIYSTTNAMVWASKNIKNVLLNIGQHWTLLSV